MLFLVLAAFCYCPVTTLINESYPFVTQWGHMALKIRLVRDDSVLLEIPLTGGRLRGKEALSTAKASEEDFVRACALHSVLSNKSRAEMLCRMVIEEDCRFAELMEGLGLNQKVVTDGLKRMIESGLVERVAMHRREVHYRPSQLGLACFLTHALIGRIVREVEEMRDDRME